MGLLKVTGTIDLEQFWPVGGSDADTTKIKLTVAAGAFKYSESGSGGWQTVKLFDDAEVRGKGGRTPIVKNGQITARLQGIDAPELHYRPQMPRGPKTDEQREAFLEVNEEYRQHLAETSVVALVKKLRTFGAAAVRCEVTTAVEKPNHVFDTYGRLVGDLWVGSGARRLNVNEWLVSAGHAYPAFYNSMAEDEIERLLRASRPNRAGKLLWRRLRRSVGKFDEELIFRRPSADPEFDPSADAGPVLMPKLFRRQAQHFALNYAGFTTDDFKTWLSAQKSDRYFLLDEFVDDPNTAQEHQLADLLTVSGADFRIAKAPDQIIVKEAASTLLDADGTPITDWR